MRSNMYCQAGCGGPQSDGKSKSDGWVSVSVVNSALPCDDGEKFRVCGMTVAQARGANDFGH